MRSYTMKNRKKLIAKTQLSELSQLRKLGVPIKKLIQEHTLALTAPTLVRLLDHYEELNLEVYGVGYYRAKQRVNGNASLFPTWVQSNEKGVQVQPDDWKYLGKFPHGKWEHFPETQSK